MSVLRRWLFVTLATAGASPVAAQSALGDQIRRFREGNEVAIMRELTEFLALRNVASNEADIRTNARHLVAMMERDRDVWGQLPERLAKPARLQEIALHVDDDERCLPEAHGQGCRFGFDRHRWHARLLPVPQLKKPSKIEATWGRSRRSERQRQAKSVILEVQLLVQPFASREFSSIIRVRSC